MRNDGSAVITSPIPDTITSWFISAFAMDQVTGLGIAPNSAKVTVFRPFFIKLSLPYSIIRGESIALQAIVFNYFNKPIEAEVVMDNRNNEFEFTNAANEIEFADTRKVTEKKKFVTIPANDGVSVTFLITPKKIGYIDIKITATAPTAGDAVLKKLLVKPEGQTQYFNKAVLVDLKDPNSSAVKKNISIVIPNNAVPGSERVTISGIGDIMGPTVNNLDDLLRMPYGCGEQNMLNFVPNIVVLDYLSRTNRLTPAIKSKAISNIESGYQRELTYKREDGSFSAFGNNDKKGNATNMAVMEVELPSGYVADVEALPSVTRAKEIKRIDTSKGDTNVIIYFDRITRDEICLTVPAHRTHRVANNKAVPVTVYDYYDRQQTSRILYEPKLVTFCDLCETTADEPVCQKCSQTRGSGSDYNNELIQTSDSSDARLRAATKWTLVMAAIVSVKLYQFWS
ncbi:unnamed protein product [Medioppia subpectinata]|uniref:Uncharacterized protein n=1 Tax=Medioppia subpectinata TaxID=1979941 RepID=A0A7R9Q8H4_9ACAR|nr:unnamed protein product [Medioppia subpectinata]CAG2115839.1 unnamed protein product [Medioppia subpectinata]